MTTLIAAVLGAVLGAVLSPLLLSGALRVEGVRRGHWRPLGLGVVTTLTMATLCACLAGDQRGRAVLPAALTLAALGLLLAVVDLDTHRLPDLIVLPAYPVIFVLLAAGSWHLGGWQALLRAVVAAGLTLLGYGALSLAAPQGLGFGDVKFAGLLALPLGWLSWGALAVGLALGFGYGAVAILALAAVGRAGLKTEVPFGPAMLAGGLTGTLFGDQIAAFLISW